MTQKITLKVASRLHPQLKVKYIAKRFKEKYKDIVKEDLKDFKTLLGNIKDYPNVKFIVFEEYNLPNLHYKLYSGDLDYEDMKEDYFSDCDGEETIMIYDVEKDKFVEV